MRAKGINIQQVILGLALLAALCWNFAHASEIKHLRLTTGATGTRADIGIEPGVEYKIISLQNPDRLVVDLPGADAAHGLQVPAATGLIKQVRVGHPVAGTTRIVFDLSSAVMALKPRVESGVEGPQLVLEWPDDGGDPIARIAANTPTVLPTAPAPATQESATVPQAADTPDPSLTSSAATSRLVAQAIRSAQVSSSATTPRASSPSGSSTAPSSAVAAPSNEAVRAAATLANSVPTTVATGIPTRVASGVPTAMPASQQQAVAARTQSSAPAQVQAQPQAPLGMINRAGMRPLIVAIDAGHGGQDPGAIGMTGKREKDVTLAIARELARQINATPGLKAYLTRSTDVFIPLPKRAQLARTARADIFVSVHADAAENRSATGSSVYVLSLKGASSQRARWLADKENAADLIGGRVPQAGNTLASVLLDLTQSGHMKASEDAASHVLQQLGSIGKNHKSGIERANFAVLRTSDMPSMLVETAFISNPDEERRLNDPSYQRTLAGAILQGIDTYFVRQPPPGTMYAARASASGAGSRQSGGGSP